MSIRHCIWAALALAVSAPAAVAQLTPPPPQPALRPGAGTSTFLVFVRGAQIGTEQIAVTRTTDGWSILSTGRIGAPVDITARRMEVRYTADWKPLEFTIDAIVRNQPQSIRTLFDGATARNDITIAGQTSSKADPIEPGAIILPNALFAPYEALAAVLKTAAPDATIPVYVLPQASLTLKVVDVSTEQIQTAARLIAARKTHVTLSTPNLPLDMNIWGDENGRLLRLTVPAQNIDVARDDVASVASRQVVVSRPNDERVRIPANGFSLAATVSKPAQAAGPLPAIVLISGSGPADRDGLAFGIPTLGELASAIADAGFVVVRYDKRGVGQSGGRPESAGLTDFSDDQRAAVKYLLGRKDVDEKRIVVAGHSEGGLVSLISADRDKRVAAVVLLATPGIAGSELVLAQQQRILSRSNLPEADRQTRIDLQRRINEAAMTGKGLEQFPPEVRRQIDNAEFQSLLNTDPARIVPGVRQPILIIQGMLDTQVEPMNADRLETLARARKQQPSVVDVVKIPGINHLLVPATTGEVDEYASLSDRHVSPAVSAAVVDWLKKILK